MSKVVKSFIESLDTGDVKSFANMTVVPTYVHCGEDLPLLDEAPPEVEYITLEEGMKSGDVSIQEQDGGATVPEVTLANDSSMPVVLIDGEEIIGAKQNRLINVTIIAAAKTSVTIPVSCVEAGRWMVRTHKFGHAGRIVPHDLRAKKTRSVTKSVREGRGHRSNQGEVWNEVHKYHMEFGTSSPTESLSDAMDTRMRDIGEYVEAFPLDEQQTGSIFGVAGRAAGFELLATPRLYHRLHRKVVASYAMHAQKSRSAEEIGCDPEQLERLLKRAASSRWQKYKTPGDGVELRAENKDITGTAVVHEGRLVHLVVSAA